MAKQRRLALSNHRLAKNRAVRDAAGSNDPLLRDSVLKRTYRSLSPPTHLGKYRVIRELGSGGQGRVYLATPIDLPRVERRVAIKVGSLPKGISNNAILDEVKHLCALTHERIVRLFDVFPHGDDYCFVMEYAGLSLYELLRSPLKPSLDRLVLILAQVADGLQHAHEKGFVHRDVKPANILVDANDPAMPAKIADFGLSVQGADAATDAIRAGTLTYASPEQVDGRLAIDTRTDIWSLGVVLYQLLTGRLPFSGPTDAALARAICRARPVAPRAIRPNVDPDLEEICLRCLHRDPDHRFPRASDLSQALRSWREQNDESDAGASARTQLLLTLRLSSSVAAILIRPQHVLDLLPYVRNRASEVGPKALRLMTNNHIPLGVDLRHVQAILLLYAQTDRLLAAPSAVLLRFIDARSATAFWTARRKYSETLDEAPAGSADRGSALFLESLYVCGAPFLDLFPETMRYARLVNKVTCMCVYDRRCASFRAVAGQIDRWLELVDKSGNDQAIVLALDKLRNVVRIPVIARSDLPFSDAIVRFARAAASINPGAKHQLVVDFHGPDTMWAADAYQLLTVAGKITEMIARFLAKPDRTTEAREFIDIVQLLQLDHPHSRKPFLDWRLATTRAKVTARATVSFLGFVQALSSRFQTQELAKVSHAVSAFHQSHGHFPEDVCHPRTRRRLLSWRVQILPFLGYQSLFERFRLDEPWDSKHNRSLLLDMPFVLRSDKASLSGFVRVLRGLQNVKSVTYLARTDIMLKVSEGRSMVFRGEGAEAIWTRPDAARERRRNVKGGSMMVGQ
jgi:serine/threonine protein kinase